MPGSRYPRRRLVPVGLETVEAVIVEAAAGQKLRRGLHHDVETAAWLFGHVRGAAVRVENVILPSALVGRSTMPAATPTSCLIPIHNVGSACPAGQYWVGVFHSHPAGPPIPSPTDCVSMNLASLVWLLAGRTGHDAWRHTAWRASNGRLLSLQLLFRAAEGASHMPD
jgi:proteasome lid subunit RPN8/RPN11